MNLPYFLKFIINFRNKNKKRKWNQPKSLLIEFIKPTIKNDHKLKKCSKKTTNALCLLLVPQNWWKSILEQ